MWNHVEAFLGWLDSLHLPPRQWESLEVRAEVKTLKEFISFLAQTMISFQLDRLLQYDVEC